MSKKVKYGDGGNGGVGNMPFYINGYANAYPEPTVTVSTGNYTIDTGWRCAICFQVAQVNMQGVTLCVDHARLYNFGYGKTLKRMRNEFDKTNGKK